MSGSAKEPVEIIFVLPVNCIFALDYVSCDMSCGIPAFVVHRLVERYHHNTDAVYAMLFARAVTLWGSHTDTRA